MTSYSQPDACSSSEVNAMIFTSIMTIVVTNLTKYAAPILDLLGQLLTKSIGPHAPTESHRGHMSVGTCCYTSMQRAFSTIHQKCAALECGGDPVEQRWCNRMSNLEDRIMVGLSELARSGGGALHYELRCTMTTDHESKSCIDQTFPSFNPFSSSFRGSARWSTVASVR